MAEPDPVRQQLEAYRSDLVHLPTYWRNWSYFEAWIAGVRPFLRRHFPDDLPDFENLARKPEWLPLTDPLGEHQNRRQAQENHLRVSSANEEMAQNAEAKLRAFMDSLIRL